MGGIRSLDSKRGLPDLKKLTRVVADMELQRQSYVPVWQEIAKYITPGRGSFDDCEPNRARRKDEYLLDPTPLQALGILASGLQGGLTSPSRPWFRLGIADPALADDGQVRLWLDVVERRMTQVLGQSNIYNCLHTLYSEVGSFGIGALIVEQDERSVLRGYTMTAGDWYVSFGSDSMPDCFARKLWMTPAQMAEMFGTEALSDRVRNLLESEREEWTRVCHIIRHRRHVHRYDSGLPEDMPYESIYWEEARTDAPLAISGYRQFPVFIPRWDVCGNSFYGRGPGWDALGESKTLHEMRYDYLVAQKMGIQPPMIGPTDLRRARANLTPGGITYLDSVDPNRVFRPLYQVSPDIGGQLKAMEDSRGMIRSTFYADLFLAILSTDQRDITARQVEEMHSEKMMMVGPVLERLENELLDPLIARTYALMDEAGLIPEPPEDLDGRVIEVDYISMLAQAQQMMGLSGIDRLSQFVGGLAQLKPDVLDKLDADEATDQYARMLGVPAAVVRSDEDVAAVRERRAEERARQEQAERMAQMAAGARQGAGALKDVSQAAAGGGLDQIAALVGGDETMGGVGVM